MSATKEEQSFAKGCGKVLLLPCPPLTARQTAPWRSGPTPPLRKSKKEGVSAQSLCAQAWQPVSERAPSSSLASAATRHRCARFPFDQRLLCAAPKLCLPLARAISAHSRRSNLIHVSLDGRSSDTRASHSSQFALFFRFLLKNTQRHSSVEPHQMHQLPRIST